MLSYPKNFTYFAFNALILAVMAQSTYGFELSGSKWLGAETDFYINIPGTTGFGIPWKVAFITAMDQWSNNTRFTFNLKEEYRDPCSNDGLNGVDFAEEMVKAASNNIARRDVLNADVRQMDAENLEFPDASFDYVLCGFGLGYITNIHRVLEEIQRVLRPGCTLALSTWGEEKELANLYRKLEVEFSIVQPDLESYHLGTVDALEQLLDSSGFSNTEITKETVKVIFDNKQEYWAQRMPIEQIAVEDLDPAGASFRRAVYDMLEDFLYIDGVHEVRNVLYAVAST